MFLDVLLFLTDSPFLNGIFGAGIGAFFSVFFEKVFQNSESLNRITKKPLLLGVVVASFFFLGLMVPAAEDSPTKPPVVKDVTEEVVKEPEIKKPTKLKPSPPKLAPNVITSSSVPTPPKPENVSFCSKIGKSTYAVVGTFDGSQNDKLAREFAGVIPSAMNFNSYYFMESAGSPESFLSQNDLRGCVDWLIEVEITSVGEEYRINLRKVRVDNQQSERVGELTREFLERGEERAISTFVKWFEKKHLKDFPRK